MASAIEKVIEIAANNLFDNASVQSALTAVIDLSNNLDTRVNSIIDSAPDALNTLNELAAALNDDANYATTVTNLLATKYSAGSDASFNDLSANDVSGVNFFTTGGNFIGNLLGNATSATTVRPSGSNPNLHKSISASAPTSRMAAVMASGLAPAFSSRGCPGQPMSKPDTRTGSTTESRSLAAGPTQCS